MTSPNLDLIYEVDRLAQLAKGVGVGSETECFDYLSEKAFIMAREADKKLDLARICEKTFMKDSGFYRGLINDSKKLNDGAKAIMFYLFPNDEEGRPRRLK